MRWRRGLTIAVAGLVAVVLLAVAAVFALRYFNIDAAREVVVQRLEALTGRDVDVRGDFDLAPSLAPTVVAEGVTVANAPWGSRPAMLTADRIEVQLQLIPLLWEGDVRIDRLVLGGADLLLETGPEGQANWQFGEAEEPAPTEPAPAFALDEVAIQNSRLTWHDIPTDRTETVAIDRFTWQADDVTSTLTVDGTGEYRSRPFTVSGELGSIADLLAATDPYPVALEATLGDLQARVEGGVSPEFPGANTRLEVALVGDRLADLGDLVGTDLPALGPYRVETVLAGNEQGGLTAEPLRATVGSAETVLLNAEGRVGDLLAGEGIRLRAEAEGAAVAALGDLLGTELPALGPYTVQGTLTGSLDSLTLTDLTGQLGREGELQVRVTGGDIARLLEGQGIDLALEAEGPRLAALGDLVGAELPALGPYVAEGRLTGSTDALALTNLTGRLGTEDALQVRVTEGRIGQLLEGQGIELAVEAEGPEFAALGELIDTELPELGAYTARGTLAGSMDALALSDLTAAVGEGGGTVVRVTDGAVASVLTGAGIRLPFAAEGESVAALADLAGIEMAPFGPYTVEGTLVGDLDDLGVIGLVAAAGDEASRVNLAGTVEELLEVAGLDLAVEVEGANLAALSPLVGVDLPASDPYRMAGQVTGSTEDLLVDGLEATLADSTVSGRLAAQRLGQETPRIEGTLTADRLDVDRILALADAAGEEEESLPAEEEGAADNALLPLDVLNELEADLALGADEVLVEGATFRNASVNLVLQDGRLSVQNLTMQVAGGTVAGDVAVDAEQPAAAEAERPAAEVTVSLSANDIDVAQLMTDLGAAAENIVGEVDIDLNVDSTGRSLDQLLGELEGDAAVVAEDGEVEDVPLDLLVPDLDILRILPPFWRRDGGAVRVNCLVGEFDIEEGVARTEAMLDTQRMTLLGQGTVDLGEEVLDLRLRPVPKSQKLSAAAVPLDIEGPLTEPEVRPEVGAAIGQAVRGVLGGLLVPLNQIAGLFGRETVDACIGAVQQARERRAAGGGAGAGAATAPTGSPGGDGG